MKKFAEGIAAETKRVINIGSGFIISTMAIIAVSSKIKEIDDVKKPSPDFKEGKLTNTISKYQRTSAPTNHINEASILNNK